MSTSQTNQSKQEFDVLYATLREIQTSLLDSTAKVAGFLLLVTGWLVTSEGARKFLQSDKASKYLALISLAGAFAFYVCASGKAFQISQRTFVLLNQLQFMPPEYYELRRVDRFTLLIFVAGNFFLVVLAGYMVWRV